MPVTLRTAKAPNSVSTRSAALRTRISCVLGFTNRQAKKQSVTISVMRRTKDIISPTMEILYPILIGQVKRKAPILTLNSHNSYRANHFLDADLRLYSHHFYELTLPLIDLDC